MTKKTIGFRWITCFLFSIGTISYAQAQNRTVNLTIAYKSVNYTGKRARAIAVNNQIPGPTLHFKEGDHVTINVHNHIDQGTSLHWHGLIIPWRMDGVDGVTQKSIPPGGVFHYKFTLHQHGTYWYHSHSEFQEQEGVYGGIIIDPPKKKLHYNKDFVVVLSDWNNTNPNQVYANLKKEGDFYAIDFPMQPSLVQFFRDYHSTKTPHAKKKILASYKMMQKMRMSIYDISDIAYDAYLLNGHTKSSPWIKNVTVGDVVRLRFIGASASSFYSVKIPGTTLLMVGADGNDIKPYPVKSFSIGPGETFDVLVKITKNHPYAIYTESADSLGVAIGILKTQPNQTVNYKHIKPFPKPKPIMMMGHNMHKKSDGNKLHTSMKKKMHHTPDHRMQKQKIQSFASGTKYNLMQSLRKTNNPNTPVQIINMKLGGYMDHYVWFLNDTPFYKAKPILIKHGQRYRLIFTNDTMMNHPMHIHGHWFILRNGHGAYDPKLHTIVVPPGATVVADLDANETGQWFFHCHNLTHMKAGMANIFRYVETPKKDFLGLSGHKKIGWYNANQLDLNADFINRVYEGNLNVLVGSDYNKLQLHSRDAEVENGKLVNANMDVFYWRLISQFWAVKGGINYVYRPSSSPYLQPGIGLEGLMPYFIQTDVRAYLHEGSTKLDIELTRDTQITHRIFLNLSAYGILATKTIAKDEIGSGLNSLQWTIQPLYQLNPNVALYLQYQLTNYYGPLRNIISNEGRSTHESTYSIGVSLLF
jgi:FtsP/CotA-like multicopper oxidase with cupredoxin domain